MLSLGPEHRGMPAAQLQARWRLLRGQDSSPQASWFTASSPPSRGVGSGVVVEGGGRTRRQRWPRTTNSYWGQHPPARSFRGHTGRPRRKLEQPPSAALFTCRCHFWISLLVLHFKGIYRPLSSWKTLITVNTTTFFDHAFQV